jgi:ubiquitin-like protein Pup
VTVADADDWLDDIDAALEENVLEVLIRFVQKGGQAILPVLVAGAILRFGRLPI